MTTRAANLIAVQSTLLALAGAGVGAVVGVGLIKRVTVDAASSTGQAVVAVSDLVLHVLGSSTPVQVAERVVISVVVTVAAVILVRRLRPHKSFQHQLVNLPANNLAVAVHADKVVAVSKVGTQHITASPASRFGPNAALVRHLVIGERGYIGPGLWHVSSLTRHGRLA